MLVVLILDPHPDLLFPSWIPYSSCCSRIRILTPYSHPGSHTPMLISDAHPGRQNWSAKYDTDIEEQEKALETLKTTRQEVWRQRRVGIVAVGFNGTSVAVVGGMRRL